MLNHHFSTLSAAVTTNVNCLHPPLVVTKDTYGQANIWKEISEKKSVFEKYKVSKQYFFLLNHHFSTLSAAVTTNDILLHPLLVITKDISLVLKCMHMRVVKPGRKFTILPINSILYMVEVALQGIEMVMSSCNMAVQGVGIFDVQQ